MRPVALHRTADPEGGDMTTGDDLRAENELLREELRRAEQRTAELRRMLARAVEQQRQLGREQARMLVQLEAAAERLEAVRDDILRSGRRGGPQRPRSA
jgi:hypothetical protein